LGRHHDSPAILKWLLDSTVFIWFSFGVITLVLIAQVRYSALSQHLFIIICSLWIAAVPYLTKRVLARAKV